MSEFARKGHELVEDAAGPTIVTVVNSMQNPQSDIKRDIEAANLSSITKPSQVPDKLD